MEFFAAVNDSDDDSDVENNAGFKMPAHLAARLQKRNEVRKKLASARRCSPPKQITLGGDRNILCNLTNATPKLDRRQTMIVGKVARKGALQDRVVLSSQKVSKELPIFQSEDYYQDFINSVIATSFQLEETKFNPTAIMNMNPSSSLPHTTSSAPLKDGISKKAYKKEETFDRLRKNAIALYNSNDVRAVHEMLTTEMKHVKRFYIRKDKSVRDVGMKKKLLDIFSNYNPLWLKVAVETVFGIQIAKFNAAAVAQTLMQHLITFNKMAADRGFKSVNTFFMKDKNKDLASYHVLYHFLMLVHFMDFGKKKRLIDHDPCLFRVDIPNDQKSSRQSVVEFASLYVTGVGNIIATLANAGIFLEHSQKPIEEFNFSVTNLGQDLLCGVRLARLVEIILRRNDILPQLLYPSENRTRKFHNMEIVFKILEAHLPSLSQIEITSRDIVEGKRAKVLTFLEEICKFHQDRQRLLEMAKQEEKLVVIQRWWRRHLAVRREREQFLKARNAALFVQQKWRANRAAKKDRRQFLQLKEATVKIQVLWRACLEGRRVRKEYEALNSRRETAAIAIQQFVRGIWVMREARLEFLNLKNAAIVLQQHWRAKKEGQRVREEFVRLQAAALGIQQAWRAMIEMRRERAEYRAKREATTKIQLWYKAHLVARPIRQDFLQKRQAALKIQVLWRACLEARRVRKEYEALKLRRETAAIAIQRFARATWAMRKARFELADLKKSAIVIQQRWRAKKDGQRVREEFARQKAAALCIQQVWRAKVDMRRERTKYLAKREAAIKIQLWYKAHLVARPMRQDFLQKRQAAANIQAWWRACLEARRVRKEYEALKVRHETAAVAIQQFVRATWAMRKARTEFADLKKAAIVVQQRWRAKQEGQRVREEFARRKAAVLCIQQAWRATIEMRRERAEYRAKREAAIKIQLWCKAHLVARPIRQDFLQKRQAALKIQAWWRAAKRGQRMKTVVLDYTQLCNKSATRIEALWRGFVTRRQMGPIFAERRRQLALAAQRATEDKKLINVVKEIIEHIPRVTRFGALVNDLRRLQYATDNSNEVCHFLLTQPDLLYILVNLLGDFNRSEPHKLMIINILVIFHSIMLKIDGAVEVIFANEDLLALLTGFLKSFLRSPNVLEPTVKVVELYLQSKSEYHDDCKLIDALMLAKTKLINKK